jgi:hypothetical protein
MAAPHLGSEHVCGRQNAVARQRFCPLQGLELLVFFRGFAGARVSRAQGRLSNAPTADFPIAATIRAEPLLPGTAPNRTATAGADDRRIPTGNRAHRACSGGYAAARVRLISALRLCACRLAASSIRPFRSSGRRIVVISSHRTRAETSSMCQAPNAKRDRPPTNGRTGPSNLSVSRCRNPAGDAPAYRDLRYVN